MRIGKTSAITAAATLLASTLAILAGPASTPAAHASVQTATCNDTTTDASAIQTAIDNSAPGDQVIIRSSTSNTCLINATIKLRDSRRYTGDSRGVIIKQANGANLAAMFASASWVDNVSYTSEGEQIEHLQFDGNKANNTSTATVGIMLRTWDSSVSDVKISNTGGDGIRVTSTSSNGTHLTGSSVNSTIENFFITDAGGDGVHVVDPDNYMTDWTLSNGWIASSGLSGVDSDNAAGWAVQNLHIYGNQVNAIKLNRCYGTRVSGNYIEDFGLQQTSSTTYYGIFCNPVQGGATSTITGNNVEHFNATYASTSTYRFIQLDGPSSGTGYAAVTGNGVNGTSVSSETGLYFSGGSLTATSTGNTVTNTGTQTTVSSATVGAGV